MSYLRCPACGAFGHYAEAGERVCPHCDAPVRELTASEVGARGFIQVYAGASLVMAAVLLWEGWRVAKSLPVSTLFVGAVVAACAKGAVRARSAALRTTCAAALLVVWWAAFVFFLGLSELTKR